MVSAVGLREMLNQHPKPSAAIAGMIVVIGLAAVVLNVGGSGRRPVSEGRAYFSVDDGKTWFADASSNPSPFNKDGKTAYRVFVWRCGTAEPFVSHLFRNASSSTGGDRSKAATNADDRTPPAMSGASIEVKRPGTGDRGWVRADSAEGSAIARPQCPDGTTKDLEAVEP